MGNLKTFSICFCCLFTTVVVLLCGASAARADGSDLESDKNDNGNIEGEQWTTKNDNNGDKDESDSQRYDQQNGNNDQNSDNDKNSGYRKQTLAKVIREQQGPQTLDEIYSGKHVEKYARDNASNNGGDQQVLFNLKFPRDFHVIDPRNPNSLFAWRRSLIFTGEATTVNASLADNAEFKLVGAKKYGSPGYVQMTSLPYVVAFGYQEAGLGPKQDLNVGSSERILGRMKLACHIVGAENTSYNRTEVSDPSDDFRLALCQFQMSNTNNTFPLFYIGLTNKSVWAVYTGRTFVAKRKVGIRERYDSVVDAGIELDKRQNVVNFYLNGYKVWTINSIGAPPPDDGTTQIDYGSVGTPTLVNITTVAYGFANSKPLDQSDPNAPSETKLLRLQAFDSPFYSPSTSFYYPNPNRLNFLWGQGAILKAYKLIIVKTTSRQLQQPTALRQPSRMARRPVQI